MSLGPGFVLLLTEEEGDQRELATSSYTDEYTWQLDKRVSLQLSVKSAHRVGQLSNDYLLTPTCLEAAS